MMRGMRLDPATSLLVIVDVQERLVPAIPAGGEVVSRCRRLAEAAGILGVKTVVTEQYPTGLGGTVPALAAVVPGTATKLRFSCSGCEAFEAAVAGVDAVVLAGLETHVCIAQTALDLLGRGLLVFLVVDAVASRHAVDHEVGLRRLEAAGVIPVTSEAVLFEWMGTAEHPRFQEIRRLVLG
jgi:nicotinamidase-related amidase